MYLDHFKLRELPFRLSADSRFHFLGVMQEMVKSQLRQGLVECDGCLLLTGEAGVGKTVMMEDLLQGLADHYRVVQINLPDIGVAEFYRAALSQLGEESKAEQCAALSDEFETCLERNAAARRIVVVVLDGGELASPDLLQEFLEISRRNAGGIGNLRVLLAGRPSLEHSLKLSAGRLASTILHLRLGALEPRDTRRYVRHRLEIAGGGAEALLDEDCHPEIQRFTGGVPRLINTLADAALVLAFNRNRSRVSLSDIRGAVDQLQWVEFKARQPGSDQEVGDILEVDSSAERMTSRLRIMREGQVLVEFDLPAGKISIGRATNNDVRIDSQFISRHHCHILTTRQYSVIEDLQSQNGIVVDGRRISVHRLRDGDEVALGDHKLVFNRVDGVPATESGTLFPMILSPQLRSDEESRTRVLSFRDGVVRPVEG
ncbi:MAG: FHA domain-containing protein [Steroidobacteraceae bacterium]